jgi:hypothetical protein
MHKLKHRDRLAPFSGDEHKTLYEKLARLPIEELLYIRDELERIRVQEQRSKIQTDQRRAMRRGKTNGNKQDCSRNLCCRYVSR